MATDFWASSHYKRWIVDRTTVAHARAEDALYVEDPEYLDFLDIFFANCIAKLCKKLGLQQRVVATATIFFKRFFLKNSYCEIDPYLVIAACCYVAAKAEESPVHIKNVVSESRSMFSQDLYGSKNFPSDNSKVAEMEFYLVDDLECDLTVFHPYRTLMALVRKEGQADDAGAEAGEVGVGVGVGVDDGQRYWGTGEGRLELSDQAFTHAGWIINDTYRSNLCLLYPPHLLAIAALYLTLVFQPATRAAIQSMPDPPPPQTVSQSTQPQQAPSTQTRRSSRQSAGSSPPKKSNKGQDLIGFLAGLNVSLPLVATITQEMISLYTLWERYKDEDDNIKGRFVEARPTGLLATKGKATGASGSGTPVGTPASEVSPGTANVITPAFCARMLMKMREAKLADLNGRRQPPVNKVLGRAQAAG